MSLLGQLALIVRTFAPGSRDDDGEFQDGTAAVWTVTVDTATDGETYGVDLVSPSVSVSVSAASSSTVGGIGDQLATEWNESAAASSATAASGGDGVVTFTAVTHGADVDLVLDENAAKMTIEQTVAEVATYVDAPFMGTWRPLPATEALLLESGDRARDPRVIHTTTRLTLLSQFDSQRSAWVSPDSGTTWYELLDEFDGASALPGSGVAHWRYKALRIQEPDA